MKALVRITAVALLSLPTAAFANDYISTNPGDWFQYTNTQSGQVLRSEMNRDLGGWRNYSNWGGLGQTWVYTSDTSDHFWLWNGTTYTHVANLSGPIGETRTISFDCNDGAVTVASRGTVSTAAGTFNDVTRLAFSTSCSDAGVTSIWFAPGVGIVKWTEQNFVGEQTYELTSAMVGGQSLPAASTPTPSGRPVAPSEHDRMETILWGARDTYIVMDTYLDAFPGLEGYCDVEVILASQNTASQLRYELTQAGVSMNHVQLLVANIDTVWMRDFGPIILKDSAGNRVAADMDYYWNRQNDNAIPRAYAGYRGWPVVKADVSFEGGNFFADGRGTQFSSLGVQWFNNDMTRTEIEREFREFGTTRTVWLEPLEDEGTTHVDMFMRIMDDNHALVSRYPSWHKQYRVTEDCARRMAAEGYTVLRADVDHSYDEYGTYTNSVLANGVALVPQYASSSKNAAALAAYRSLGYDAVGVDARLIIRYSGATHCVSMQIPAGN